MICNISYGIDPSFETLPNAITSGTAGVELTQLVIGEKNFYVVSADIGSLTVKVKGSLRTGTCSFSRESKIGALFMLKYYLCLYMP